MAIKKGASALVLNEKGEVLVTQRQDLLNWVFPFINFLFLFLKYLFLFGGGTWVNG